MLFSVFNVKNPSSSSRRAFTLPLLPACPPADAPALVGGSASTPSRVRPPPGKRKTNLLDQYLAILLLVFTEAGLIDVSHSHPVSPFQSRKALARAVLTVERCIRRASPLSPQTRRTPSPPTRSRCSSAKSLTLPTASCPLITPCEYRCARTFLHPLFEGRLTMLVSQALPKLFALTSSFDASDGRMAASSALLAVNSFDRHRRVGMCAQAGGMDAVNGRTRCAH